MVRTTGRRGLLQAGAAAMLLAGAPVARAAEIPATPEPGPVRIGIEPWLGQGLWHVAARKRLFGAQGLDDVEIVDFTADADINAALAAGQLQAGSIATHTAMNFIAAGLPVRIVALLDASMTADAIVTDGSVTDVAGLRGKQVAYEEGTTSDILLNHALASAGMTVDDIVPVPMPAADAAAALIAGQVPVAVASEPHLTLAMRQNPQVRMLYAAGEEPGLISDVLVAREDFIEERPGAVAALLRAWDAALLDYEADTAGGRAIIAGAVGARPEELVPAFDAVVYYSAAGDGERLAGDFAGKVVPDVEAAAIRAGVLSGPVDLGRAIDPRFVEAAAR